MTRSSLTRRGLLQLAAAGSAVVGLAACTDTSDVVPESQQTTSDVTFKIPPSDKIPTTKVDLRAVDSGDSKALYWSAFFKAYHALHDNVNVDYQGTNWNNIQQQITLGLRNGTEPDIFQLPGKITLAQAVESKWLGAYDDVVPNWSAIRESLPVGTFAPGVNEFDGKVYSCPMDTGQRFGSLLLYNKDLVSQAGHDFSQIQSWDAFRTALKDITTKGAGKYYGVIFGLTQGGALSNIVNLFAQMAGVPNGVSGMDYRTGEYNYTNPISQEALELWLAIHADGSFFPGSTTIDWPGARGRFPQGVAAVIMQGPWNIRPWLKADPKFPLALNIPPQRDPAKVNPITYGAGGTDSYVFSAKTKAPAVVGDMWAYSLSEDGQTAWATFNGSGAPSLLPQAFERAHLDDLEKAAVEINQKYMVIGPAPSVRNPDVETVERVTKPLEPAFADVCIGLLTGQLKDVKAQLQSLQDRANKSLDDAIAAANKRGAKVSRDDYVFADWDPTKPYEKLYKE